MPGPEQAYLWASLTSFEAQPDARALKARIATGLTPDRLAVLDARFAAWQPIACPEPVPPLPATNPPSSGITDDPSAAAVSYGP